MKFTPRQDFVVVKTDEPEDKTRHGSILLPQTTREDRLSATIVAVGPGRLTDFGTTITVDDLTTGDRILFNKFAATELDEAERLYLIRGSDITCKLND